MAGTLRYGDHYEALGLAPGANDQDIARAFAKAMRASTLLTAAEFTRVSVAFETLRDPAKRQVYDASLRAPKPQYSVSGSASATVTSAPPAMAWKRGPAAKPPQPQRSPIFPAETPRPTGRAPAPPPPAHDKAEAQSALHGPLIFEGSSGRHFSRPADTSESEIEWKRIAMAVGLPVLGIALFGAIFGLSSANVDALDPKQTQTAELPVPIPAPEEERFASVDLSSDQASDTQVATASKPDSDASARRRSAAPPSAATQAQVEPDVAELIQPDRQVDDAALAASLPLPSRTIVNTIARIGYPCGEVASSTAVEGGAPGVFKITCTSGHSYQAKPVSGRYRFRR